MIQHHRVTALAVISTGACARPDTCPKAAAVAAVTLDYDGGSYNAGLHTHVPRQPADLQRWLDTLLADDPVLVGHRLRRMSRLLRAAGYDRDLQSSFARHGRVDLRSRADSQTSLAVLAATAGVAAVDERILAYVSGPISASTLADLALVNATATALIWAAVEADGQRDSDPLRAVLHGLMKTLSRGPVPVSVRAVLPCSPQ